MTNDDSRQGAEVPSIPPEVSEFASRFASKSAVRASQGVRNLTVKGRFPPPSALLPGARVVKAVASFADGLARGDVTVAGAKPTTFICCDDLSAAAVVAPLVAEVGYDPVFEGPLRYARFAEPALMLMALMAYGPGGVGPNIALKLIGAKDTVAVV